MKVTLLSFTPDALTLLLATKNARMGFDSDPATWDDAKRAEHLAYMRDTIRSSWEFVNYVFKIEGVTRAFTHQLVRTRAGSYAQESLRAVDATDHEVIEPRSVADIGAISQRWLDAETEAREAYGWMVGAGVPLQDARGILPINTTTSIVAQFNLRTLSAMAEVRLCTRTQGEYQDVFRAMRAEVIKVHPWAADFIDVACAMTGVCIFPQYGKRSCPFYSLTVTDAAHKAREEVRQFFWLHERVEAKPVAAEGKAS